MVDSKLQLNAQRLKQFRKDKGLSQERLAYACEQKRLRVSIATIKRAELGKLVSMRTATELAQFYGVELSELLPQKSSPRTVLPSPQSKASVMPVLWLRLNNNTQCSLDVISLLKRRGCVWYEQLGNTVTAVFGHFDSDRQGHVQAQSVVLEIIRQIQSDSQNTTHFFAALHLGEVVQEVGNTTISPDVLQWFAEISPFVKQDSLIVSNDIYSISQDCFSYSPADSLPHECWLLDKEKYLSHSLPLIGRSSELLQVNALLDGVSHRNVPAVIHITGVAGIGKSRLMGAVIEQANLRDFIVVSVDLEMGWDEPVQLLTLSLCQGIYEAACKKLSRSQINTLLFSDSVSKAIQHVFFSILSVQQSLDADSSFCDLNVSVDENNLIEASSVLLTLLSQQLGQRILLTIDNFHFAKKSGVSVFNDLLARCESVPITGVISSRLESDRDSIFKLLSHQAYSLTTLSLSGMPKDDVVQLCRSFKEVPEDYKAKCVEMAEGVPLYLIQLLTAYPNVNETPSSLQVLLEQKIHGLSQIDRLVVELLSVAEIDISVAALMEILLVIKEEASPENFPDKITFDPEYLITIQMVSVDSVRGIRLCHQLVRKSIAERLPSQLIKFYHRILAKYFENNSEEYLGLSLVGLAYHFIGAGNAIKAAKYFYLSASQLIDKGIYSDAQSLLLDGLEAIKDIESKERFDTEINIQLALSSIYKVNYGWVSPLVKSAYLRIEHLCSRLGGDKRLSLALFGLWTIELSTLNFKTAESLAQRCLDVASEYNDPQGQMHAYIAQSNTLFWRGKLRQAERAAFESLQLYCEEYTESSIRLLGQDPRALAGCFGAWSASLLNKAKETEHYRDILVTDVAALGHDFSSAIALQGCAWLDYHQKNPESALFYATELDRVSVEKGFPFYRGVAALFIGWAEHKLNANPGAARIVDSGYHQWLASSGDKIAYSLYCSILAEIYVDQGRLADGKELLGQGIAFSIEHNEECYIPEMYRLLSQCVEGEEKEEYLRKGLAFGADIPVFQQRINRLLEEQSDKTA